VSPWNNGKIIFVPNIPAFASNWQIKNCIKIDRMQHAISTGEDAAFVWLSAIVQWLRLRLRIVMYRVHISDGCNIFLLFLAFFLLNFSKYKESRFRKSILLVSLFKTTYKIHKNSSDLSSILLFSSIAFLRN